MNKMNTCIYCEFVIVSENNVDFITKKLDVLPTSICKRECLAFKKGNIEYSWEFQSKKVETLNLENCLKDILNVFTQKESILIKLKKDHDLYYKLSIVIEIEDMQSPGIFIDQQTITFLSNIGAELDMDLYVMS